MMVPQYYLCPESVRLPRLVTTKAAILCAFTVLFAYKKCLLLLVVFPSLIDALLNSSNLEGSFYDCLWRRDKVPWHRNSSWAYHNWPELWHYIYCFVQSEAFTMEGNNCARKLIFVVETAQNTVYTEIANIRYKEFNHMQLLQLNTQDPQLKMGVIGK